MTRQDFVLIAESIAGFDSPTLPMPDVVADTYRRELAERFADALQATNPRFDRDRFIAAATGGN